MTTRIPGMRIPLQAFLVAFAAIRSASALAVPELPPPVFADTEVSTNVAMRAWTERMRMFNVTLSFDATPSNNVQVAFGTTQERYCFCSDECYEAFRKMYPARIHRNCYERDCEECNLCVKRYRGESGGMRSVPKDFLRTKGKQ